MDTTTADAALREIASRLRCSVLFFDTETTGTSPLLDSVVSVAYALVQSNGAVSRASTLVNPGRPIPASATAIHGISDADVTKAPTFAALAKSLLVRLTGADVVAGYNIRRFDLPLLAEEFRRAGVHFDPEALRIVDAQGIFFAREPRDLTAALRFYVGAEHDQAHTAGGDVDATAIVLAAQLDRYADLPNDAGLLADVSANRDPNALDVEGKFVWRDGAAQITFGKYAGTGLHALDRGYLEWMLKQGFGTSTKRIVEAALRGEFPTREAA